MSVPQDSGVTDVRIVREAIAHQHEGDIVAHILESNRIARELEYAGRLGKMLTPPQTEMIQSPSK